MPNQVVKQGDIKVTVVHNVYEGDDLVRTIEVPLMVTPEIVAALSALLESEPGVREAYIKVLKVYREPL